MKIISRVFMTLLVTSCAGLAPAGNSVHWGKVSYITVEETPNSEDGCDGRVNFLNYNLHQRDALNEWELDFYDTKVGVRLEVDVYGPDTLHVTPPKGYQAYPESMVVPEDESGFVCLYKEEIVG